RAWAQTVESGEQPLAECGHGLVRDLRRTVVLDVKAVAVRQVREPVVLIGMATVERRVAAALEHMSPPVVTVRRRELPPRLDRSPTAYQRERLDLGTERPRTALRRVQLDRLQLRRDAESVERLRAGEQIRTHVFEPGRVAGERRGDAVARVPRIDPGDRIDAAAQQVPVLCRRP